MSSTSCLLPVLWAVVRIFAYRGNGNMDFDNAKEKLDTLLQGLSAADRRTLLEFLLAMTE